MQTRLLLALSVLLSPCTFAADAPAAAATGNTCAQWLDHDIGKLHSEETLDLCALTANHPVLLVNTASFCGYTPQFKGLEALHQQYKDKGLVVIGFPSNDFFQEADSAEETANVCFVNYGVTFPMTSEIKVKGADAHPIYQHLGSAGAPAWNFNKYLIGKDGAIIQHFDSNVTPDSAELLSAIDSAL
jgi:glutathione peroxidase